MTHKRVKFFSWCSLIGPRLLMKMVAKWMGRRPERPLFHISTCAAARPSFSLKENKRPTTFVETRPGGWLIKGAEWYSFVSLFLCYLAHQSLLCNILVHQNFFFQINCVESIDLTVICIKKFTGRASTIKAEGANKMTFNEMQMLFLPQESVTVCVDSCRAANEISARIKRWPNSSHRVQSGNNSGPKFMFSDQKNRWSMRLFF